MIVCAALLFLPVYLKSRTDQDLPERAAFRILSSNRVTVKISGDVLHSGIYELPANSLATTVINMAGPRSPLNQYKTDNTTAINIPLHGSELKLVLEPDGSYRVKVDQIKVPERMVLKIPLDINTMSETDFDRLPGIGPGLARRIVAYRQKNGGILRLEDLAAVEGIGEKKFRMLCGYF